MGLFLLVFAAANVAGLWFGQEHWRLELLSHFRWPFLVVAAGLLALSLTGRHYLCALVAFGLLCFNATLLVHNLQPPPAVAEAAADMPTYRALSINVYSRNDDVERVIRYIHAQSPDIVALIEVTGKWLPALNALKAEYPYQAQQIWGDNFGSVLLSRYPLTDPPREYGYSGVGSIARFAELPQGRCLLLLAHPIAPITERSWSWNASTINDIANYTNNARANGVPVLVLGDLNTSPWGVAFKSLLAQTSLRPPDSKRIWWPTWRHLAWPAVIPIDHFLLSSGVQDTHTWVGPNVGSDHKPIGLDFALLHD